MEEFKSSRSPECLDRWLLDSPVADDSVSSIVIGRLAFSMLHLNDELVGVQYQDGIGFHDDDTGVLETKSGFKNFGGSYSTLVLLLADFQPIRTLHLRCDAVFSGQTNQDAYLLKTASQIF